MTTIINRDERKNLSEAQKNEQFLALLNTDIAEIELLPDFVTLPAGSYIMLAKKFKIDTDKRTVSLIFSQEGVVELANDATEAPPEGSLYMETFRFDYDGIEQLRKVADSVMTENGWTTPNDFLENFPGLIFVCTIKCRRDKTDKTKIYNSISSMSLAPTDGGVSEEEAHG